jgi:hypothetical protein
MKVKDQITPKSGTICGVKAGEWLTIMSVSWDFITAQGPRGSYTISKCDLDLWNVKAHEDPEIKVRDTIRMKESDRDLNAKDTLVVVEVHNNVFFAANKGVSYKFSKKDLGDLFEVLVEPGPPKPAPAKAHSGSKYLRHPEGVKEDGRIDVYSVLLTFDVRCPATQHAIKKLLLPGARGKGNIRQDLSEARDAITRAIELLGE